MGRVFTSSEVRKKQVAWSENILDHTDRLRQLLDSKLFVGSLIFGGSLAPTPSVRTDLDFLAIYHDGCGSKAHEVIRGASQKAARDFVQLDPIIIDATSAEAGHHTISMPFLRYLAWAEMEYGHIRRNPLKHFRFEDPKSDPADEILPYLRRKLYKLEKGLATLPAMDELSRCRFLQKVLELPTQVARKVLWWLSVTHGLEHNLLSEDKEAIRAAYLLQPKGTDDKKINKLFKGLTAQDLEYSAFLNCQLARFHLAQYDTYLHHLESLVEGAIKLVALNLLLIRD